MPFIQSLPLARRYGAAKRAVEVLKDAVLTREARQQNVPGVVLSGWPLDLVGAPEPADAAQAIYVLRRQLEPSIEALQKIENEALATEGKGY